MKPEYASDEIARLTALSGNPPEREYEKRHAKGDKNSALKLWLVWGLVEIPLLIGISQTILNAI